MIENQHSYSVTKEERKGERGRKDFFVCVSTTSSSFSVFIITLGNSNEHFYYGGKNKEDIVFKEN